MALLQSLLAHGTPIGRVNVWLDSDIEAKTWEMSDGIWIDIPIAPTQEPDRFDWSGIKGVIAELITRKDTDRAHRLIAVLKAAEPFSLVWTTLEAADPDRVLERIV